MADIQIHREHPFSMTKARKIAFQWVAQAENEFGMACSHSKSDTEDVVSFSRSGVKGTLKVSSKHFELHAQLGFLLGAFKGKIEDEIAKNLDRLMDGSTVLQKKAPDAGARVTPQPTADAAPRAVAKVGSKAASTGQP